MSARRTGRVRGSGFRIGRFASWGERRLRSRTLAAVLTLIGATCLFGVAALEFAGCAAAPQGLATSPAHRTYGPNANAYGDSDLACPTLNGTPGFSSTWRSPQRA